MFNALQVTVLTALLSFGAASPHVARDTESGSCRSMGSICDYRSGLVDPAHIFANTTCTLFAVCQDGVQSVAQTLQEIGAPANQPRVTREAFNNIAVGNETVTPSQYAAAYYLTIKNTIGATQPPNSSVLYEQWERVAAWTGDCAGGQAVPYENFADWVQYSSTVKGSGTSC